MTLDELQQHFVDAIFGGDREPISGQVLPQGALDARQRVGIYRNSVHGTLGKYLGSLYPVCQELLGRQFFDHLADAYIDTYPPDSPFLPEYGAEMPVFMQTHASMQAVRWIADMARLEWARHKAWHGINQAAGDFSRLALLTPEQQAAVCFQLPDSAQLLESTFDLHAVWMAHQPEDHPDKLPLEQIELQQACQVLIWRSGRQLQQVRLTGQAFAFLQDVRRELSLPELAGQYQEQLPPLLTQAIQHGWIIAFSV